MSDPHPTTTYYSGIPSAEAGTFSIPSTTIRLYCRVSSEPTRYIYTLRNIPDILKELFDELCHTMSDIYIESSIDCGHRHDYNQYKVYIRREDTLREITLFREEKYKAISKLIASYDWEIQRQEKGPFERHFRIAFKNKYVTEPHVSFYIREGTGKITYSVLSITKTEAILCASIEEHYHYMKDKHYTLHWQVVGIGE
jgi:hypothetical protein